MTRAQINKAERTRLIASVMEERFPGWLIVRDGSGRWTAAHEAVALHGGNAVELWELLAAYKRGGV